MYQQQTQCIIQTDLCLKKLILFMLPHWDRSCRSNLLSHPVTVYWLWVHSSSTDSRTSGVWQDGHLRTNFILLLLRFQLDLWGSPIFGEIFAYETFFFFLTIPTIEVVKFRLRVWCMGVFFVASIQPSRTQMSGSFESMRWNACVHRLHLSLCSHPKEFWENKSQNPC